MGSGFGKVRAASSSQVSKTTMSVVVFNFFSLFSALNCKDVLGGTPAIEPTNLLGFHEKSGFPVDNLLFIKALCLHTTFTIRKTPCQRKAEKNLEFIRGYLTPVVPREIDRVEISKLFLGGTMVLASLECARRVRRGTTEPVTDGANASRSLRQRRKRQTFVNRWQTPEGPVLSACLRASGALFGNGKERAPSGVKSCSGTRRADLAFGRDACNRVRRWARL
jgi:hypothetical protein